MNPKDSLSVRSAHPVKSAARRRAVTVARPWLRVDRPEVVRRGDFAGHALSAAASETMPRPLRVARNTLRTSARPGALERALTDPQAGRQHLRQHLQTLAAHMHRTLATLGELSSVAINLEDRHTWAQLHAARMLVEDAATLTRDLTVHVAEAA